MKKSGKIGFAIIWLLTRPLAILPLGFHRAVGSFVGWLAGSVLKYRKGVVMINLSRSFPEKKYEELEDICHKFYRHFGTVVGEAIWFSGCSNPQRLVRSGIVTVENPGMLNRFLAKGESVIILAAHTGNWELDGGVFSYLKEPLLMEENDYCVVYKRLTSAAWDRFMHWNRIRPLVDRKNYHGLVESEEIFRYAYHNMDKASTYTFITDQAPYGTSARVNIGEFLHQSTWTMVGAAAFAKMFSKPVVFERFRIDENGNYHKTYELISENAAESEIPDMMKLYYKYLQEDLEAQPWNYLWTHKRWKEIITNEQ